MAAAIRTQVLAVFRFPCLLLLLVGLLLLPGCGKSDVQIGVGVAASVGQATVVTGAFLDVTAVVTGTSNKSVVWSVCNGSGANCVVGGNSTVGTIMQIGLDSQGNSIARYTAPATTPVPPACQAETSGCSVVLQGFLVAFKVSCFSRVTVEPGTNPVPVITSLMPSSAIVGGAAFTLTVNGSNFIASSVVRYNGSNRMTTFINSTQLQAAILAGDIAATGTAQVTVFNPPPDGGTSNMAVFNINNPVPVLTLLTPSAAVAGGTAFTLTVDGSGFVASSVVQWNGSNRTTMFVNSTQVTADIPASDIAATGTAMVTVVNPVPGGGTSNALTFTINPAVMCSEGVLERVSVDTAGTEGNGASHFVGVPPAVSADGRFVAFQSNATNLVSGDTNSTTDIFVRDTCRGAPMGCTPSTVRVSVASDGSEGNEQSAFPRLSASGRFVIFLSRASNLVPTDTNGIVGDIFLHDRDTDNDGIYDEPGFIATTLASVSTGGAQGTPEIASANWDISANGRFIVFASAAQQYTGDTDFFIDVFARDTCFGGPLGCTPSTVKVSVDSNGVPGNASSPSLFNDTVSISGSGRFVVFGSAATNLAGSDTNGIPDIFLHDRDTDTDGIFDEAGFISTTRVSVAFDGSEANVAGGGFGAQRPFISANGRAVGFATDSTNLVPSDTNMGFDVFIRDTCFGAVGCTPTTFLASIPPTGIHVGVNASLSANGRFVAFQGGTIFNDSLVRDTCLGAVGCTPVTVRVSQTTAGVAASNAALPPALSADAGFVAFATSANNLVTGDTNSVTDVFLAQTCFSEFVPPFSPGVVAALTGGEDGPSLEPSVSATGRFVAFSSLATGLVMSDTNNGADIFVADTCIGGPMGCTPSIVRVSVRSDGSQVSVGGSVAGSAISATGRFVAFHSDSDNQVPNDMNVATDVFVHDRDADNDGIFDEQTESGAIKTVRVSVAGDGTEGNGQSFTPAITPDGRFVTFTSLASNLVSGDANNTVDVFVHDRDLDNDGLFDEAGAGETATVRVSVAGDGTEGNSASGQLFAAPISATGRFVTFVSVADNLAPGDMLNIGFERILVHDRDADNDGIFDETGVGGRATVLVSRASDGTQALGVVTDPSMSSTGRFISFQSAFPLVPGDTAALDVFVHDRDADNDGIFDETGAIATLKMSIAGDGTPSNQDNVQSSLSADGRFVAFISSGTNLDPSHPIGVNQLNIFVHDRDADNDGIFDETGPGERATIRVSILPDGTEPNAHCLLPSISADGRFVAFHSAATSIEMPADIIPFEDIFLAATRIP